MTRLATFSTCGRYRYTLTRIWGEPDGERAAFILLNPSTADAEKDDPTIRRYIAYARAWGFAGVEILNLGPMNLANIHAVTGSTPTIVCGWGKGDRVVNDLRALGRTLSALRSTPTARPPIRSISRENSSRSLSPLEPLRSGESRVFYLPAQWLWLNCAPFVNTGITRLRHRRLSPTRKTPKEKYARQAISLIATI